MGAYLDGLEQAAANGHKLAGIASVASFFVSRVDTEIDKRLEKIGTDEALALRGQGGRRQLAAGLRRVPGGVLRRALGRAGREGRQGAAAAVGLDRGEEPGLLGHACTSPSWSSPTPSTRCRRRPCRPSPTTARSHGDTVTGTAAAGPGGVRRAGAGGIDLTDVFLVLEDEGVDKFEKSWTELLETVKGQLDAAK